MLLKLDFTFIYIAGFLFYLQMTETTKELNREKHVQTTTKAYVRRLLDTWTLSYVYHKSFLSQITLYLTGIFF
jgi:hypothetical protein